MSGTVIRESSDARCAWYVVSTRRHRELLVETKLAEAGVRAFLPMLRDPQLTSETKRIIPLFPGYVFVRAVPERHFRKITRTPGVRGFVTFGEEPQAVDDAIIRAIELRLGPKGVVEVPDAPSGTPVRIVGGPFRGFDAVWEGRLPGRDRVMVLLQLMQRTARVELPAAWTGAA